MAVSDDPNTGSPENGHPGHGERGFALLIVLWTMALLSLLGTQVTGIGRAETKLASALRTGAQLQEAADGALYETIWHMLDGGGDYWAPGTADYVLAEAGGRVQIHVQDERGKLDVNQAPPALMQALLSLVGADRTTAHDISNAIVEWRTQQAGDADEPSAGLYRSAGLAWGPAGQEFQRLDELLLVRGMTPVLYQAALPYLTLALEQGPWLAYADPVLLAALQKSKRDSGLAIDAADVRGPVVMTITAKAQGPNNTAFTRRAMVRLDGSLSGPAWKYRILSWETGS